MKPVFILAAILIFGLLVAIHELGHFLAAKLCGVKVNEFSIGMGPLIWHKETAETEYSLRALPVGGYCAMEGEDEETGHERSFVRQGFWKKLLVLAAGSLMNFLAGALILLALYSGVNYLLADSIVGLAPEFEYVGENGLMEGDLIYKVNGYRTYLQGDAAMFLGAARPQRFVQEHLHFHRWRDKVYRFRHLCRPPCGGGHASGKIKVYRLQCAGLCPAGMVQSQSADYR